MQTSVKRAGRLRVVATPIGHLDDLSERARRVLEEADAIAAEDTRRTTALLHRFGISRPLISLHAFNETQRVPEILARLAAGEQIALVSDAGTPLLSDPGFQLVSAAIRGGFAVEAIPGPSAITAALAIAGLPTGRFCFEGFLPARAGERRSELRRLATETRTLVFFEAPHRIVQTLDDCSAEFGPERQAVIARELTKVHESVYRGTLAELAARAATDPNFQRGEITMVVHGATQRADDVDTTLLRRAVELLAKELPPGRAAAVAAQLAGATRSAAYALLSQHTDAGARDSARVDDADGVARGDADGVARAGTHGGARQDLAEPSDES